MKGTPVMWEKGVDIGDDRLTASIEQPVLITRCVPHVAARHMIAPWTYSTVPVPVIHVGHTYETPKSSWRRNAIFSASRSPGVSGDLT